jgi:hypothetical protein
MKCQACDGAGELLCGLYPPEECEGCNGTGEYMPSDVVDRGGGA